MSVDSALANWAARAPLSPFLFFRGARGHFEWISFEDAEALRRGTLRRARWLPADVTELLRFATTVGAPASPAPVRPGPERDVWIARRPLAVVEEAELAAWAVRTGAAIVVERHDRFPVDLFAWARPTLVSDSAAAIAELLAGLERDAPNWLRRRWFRHRLGRLRAVLVENVSPGGSPDAAVETLRSIDAAWARLVPESRVRVERFSSAALSALV